MMDFASIYHLFNSYQIWIKMLHDDEALQPQDNSMFMQLALELHRYNYLLWHQEDIARRDDVDPATIAKVKRAIDELNQQRSDAIERIDEWLLSNHYGHLVDYELPVRTETPGSVFDRLSILAIKVFHMREQTERNDVDQAHIDTCFQKLKILLQQQQDLQESLIAMFTDLNNGKIRMKIYRQFKMYNDPDLNPQIYKNKSKR